MLLPLQGCLRSQPPNNVEIFIYMGDDKKTKVEAIRTFRLLLKTVVHLDLKETYVIRPLNEI